MLAQEIVLLAMSIQKEKIDVTISGLVGRNDEHEDKKRSVDLILADLRREKEVRYVDHTNIDPLKHLNRSSVHLNRSGDIIFEHLNRSSVHLNRSGDIIFDDNAFIACKK